MLDLPSFLASFGYLGLFGIVFAETGILAGFFLPGDTLLFTAGFLASTGRFSLLPVILIAFAAAVSGDAAGYAIGKKYGPAVFRKEDSVFFDRRHIERARRFFEDHGGKAVFLARFVPILRTAIPVLAGTGTMRYRDFFIYNVFGALSWTAGITLLGYYLGRSIPNLETYVLIVFGVIIAGSFVLPFLRSRKRG
jgi:membrane-associated protein